ncbi:MAG: hypothetical protein IKL31_07605 [Ruminococcus sp.]|nr:hypothetical protein [Ruminococcus sp.]
MAIIGFIFGFAVGILIAPIKNGLSINTSIGCSNKGLSASTSIGSDNCHHTGSDGCDCNCDCE